MTCTGKMIVFVLGLLLLMSPVLAEGTLTVTKGVLSAPTYINTKTITPVANMTLNTTVGSVNLTGILINIIGTASSGNVLGVFVYNDSDNNGAVGSGDALLGSSNVDTAANTSEVTLDFTMAGYNQYYLIVALNISSSATSIATVGINITSNSSLYTESGNNVTITGSWIDSGLPQIQDVHATAAISPRYVDTNVTNQSFVYTITPTGADSFNNITVSVPIGYTVVNVTYVSYSGSGQWNSTNLTPGVTVAFGSNFIDVNYTTGYNLSGSVAISFNANTNSSGTGLDQIAFNSTITGSNFTRVSTDVSGNATSVTTKDLLSIASVSVIKGYAYLNGTDYWEFRFTLNFTADVTGMLQFRMNNWTDSSGNSLSLTSCSTSCATLRNNTDASSTVNITQNYNIAKGVSLAGTQGNTDSVILKMLIPSDTAVSSRWWTTYSMLFRSTP